MVTNGGVEINRNSFCKAAGSNTSSPRGNDTEREEKQKREERRGESKREEERRGDKRREEKMKGKKKKKEKKGRY